MTGLGCTVNTCAYNVDRHCSLSNIQVAGKCADCERDTCCSSFHLEKGGAKNGCGCDPKSELTVKCLAAHCVYNADQMCSAKHIDIGGNGASRMEETECQSFRARN